MSAPIRYPFFSETVDHAIHGRSPDDQLTILADLISEAQADKEAGYGPPQHDINRARRLWLDIYASLYGRAA